MSSFASSNKNDNNKPSTPRQKKYNVFTRLVPQTIRMLEHMPQFSNNSSSQSEEAERKVEEEKLFSELRQLDVLRRQTATGTIQRVFRGHSARKQLGGRGSSGLENERSSIGEKNEDSVRQKAQKKVDNAAAAASPADYSVADSTAATPAITTAPTTEQKKASSRSGSKNNRNKKASSCGPH